MPRFGLLIVATSLALAALSGIALSKTTTVWNVNEETVRKACGDNLQSSGGSFGCVKCYKSDKCYDYGCSDGANGAEKGCRRTAYKPVTDQGVGSGLNTNVGGSK